MTAMLCPCCRQPVASVVRDPHVVLALLALTERERALAGYLADNLGRWKRSADQVEAVYGADPDGGPDTAAQLVRRTLTFLRRKLADTPLMIEGRQNGRGGLSGNRLVWRAGA